MKRVFAILVSLLLSFAIVFGIPLFFNAIESDDYTTNLNEHLNEVSIINQKILGYQEEEYLYHKLYDNGQLVGVVCNYDNFNSLINQHYEKYSSLFPNTKLGLTSDVYIVDEVSNIVFENIDSEIVDYLDSNNRLGIETTAIEFSTAEGVYEIIYVSNEDDFYEARDNFFQNFVSDDTLKRIQNGETISSPVDFGSIETNINIQETISITSAIASPSEIFIDSSQIYEFLCYGRNQERQYYETKEGDTVQAVGYYFGDMTSRQVMMLNPSILSNENQVIVPGTKLNVTYYTSPLTIVVTKQRLSQETVFPDSPIYIEDETVKSGERRIEREEENGISNILYEETWVNGVIQKGDVISENIKIEPVQGIIRVGTKHVAEIGTGNFGFPVDNPIITCSFTCYLNHGGVDFQNMYDKWGEVLAADGGVVESVGWTDIGGYYARINHNNGFTTYYGHMRTMPYVEVGQTVERGDVLGPIGMTGNASGPHVHFAMYYENALINPCTHVACEIVSWG